MAPTNTPAKTSGQLRNISNFQGLQSDLYVDVIRINSSRIIWKQAGWDSTLSSRWKLVTYHVLRQAAGGVSVVVKGPWLATVKVSVNVAEKEVSQVVSLTLVMTAVDIAVRGER